MPDRPSLARFDGRAYQARFDALARDGRHLHGEADLVASFAPARVLDAGCGTGRVAIELARRGIDVVGADVSESMITEARRLAPSLRWVLSDLADLQLGERFDVVVMAGNVPLFTPEAGRDGLVAGAARHVSGGGRLVAGFQLGQGYELSDYDRCCAGADLVLEDRWSTWDRSAFSDRSDYAVSVHLAGSDPPD